MLVVEALSGNYCIGKVSSETLFEGISPVSDLHFLIHYTAVTCPIPSSKVSDFEFESFIKHRFRN